METIIIPIIKHKNDLVMDKDNYRPVAATSVVSKIIELILLDRLHDTPGTICNQFGFKSNHATGVCLFSLKYYNSRSSPVYVCHLDPSKAFDRIIHWCLFKQNSLIVVLMSPMECVKVVCCPQYCLIFIWMTLVFVLITARLVVV